MYMGIPVLFRRLYQHAGDVSKTSRERHVTSRLYAFTVFNNVVVFSVFGSAWRFVASVIAAQNEGVWAAIKDAHLFSKVMTGLCNVSTFWLTWQMQRNLGAAVDISQAWPLVWSFVQRRFFSPTPRQLIELSAPQPFPYADYYSNYLTVATVGLCFGALQPIVLPITAFYLGIEVPFKKYLLQYVLITKTESGGRFWKLLVNRLLFSVMLANAVIALVVGAQGIGSVNSVRNGNMLYAMIPLPLLILLFKWYCVRAFDDKLTYYAIEPYSDTETNEGTDSPKTKRKDKVSVRFGHPALYKRLLAPMVHAKSQHLLKEVYGHRSRADNSIFDAPHRRSTDRAMPQTPLGYSDMFMSEMDPEQTGKLHTQDLPPVEIIEEQDLDFENFKKRAEFREEFGGDGELYGRPEDLVSRPSTPSTFATLTDVGLYGRGGEGSGTLTRNSSATRLGEDGPNRKEEEEGGTSYGHGYQPTPRRDRFESIDIAIPETPLDAGHIIDVGRRQESDGRTEQGQFQRRMSVDDPLYEPEGYFAGLSAGQDEDTSYNRFRERQR
jgi:calcium permeable stress-gated cation channel